MTVYCVSYDLRAPGRNYNKLYDALEEYENCHATESFWFIDSPLSASEIREHLCGCVDDGDQIYVMKLVKRWAACRTEPCTRWLKNSARTW